MDKRIALRIKRKDGPVSDRCIEVKSVLGARFCGRDREAVRTWMKSLGSKGPAVTRSNPSIYAIGRYLLTTCDWIEVQGPRTGGEVELVAIRDRNEIFITVGSDHCDRDLDPLFADKPKQMCPHPIASIAWPYEEVHNHWDALAAEAFVVIGPHRLAYQRFELGSLVSLDALLSMDRTRDAAGAMALFCGTGEILPSIADDVKRLGLPENCLAGGGDEFQMVLHDSVLGRSIKHAYRIRVLGDDLSTGERVSKVNGETRLKAGGV